MTETLDTPVQRHLKLRHCLPNSVAWFLPLGSAALLTIVYAYFAIGVKPVGSPALQLFQNPILIPAVFFLFFGLFQLVDQIRVLVGWRGHLEIEKKESYGEKAYRFAENVSAGGLGATDRKRSLAVLQSISLEVLHEYASKLFYVSGAGVLVLLFSMFAFAARTFEHNELLPNLEGRVLLIGIVAASGLYIPSLVLSALARQTSHQWLQDAMQFCGLELSAAVHGNTAVVPTPDPDPFANVAANAADEGFQDTSATFTSTRNNPSDSFSGRATLDASDSWKDFNDGQGHSRSQPHEETLQQHEPPQNDDDDPFKELGI